MSKASAGKAAEMAARAADAAARAADAAAAEEGEVVEPQDLGPLFTLEGDKADRHDRTQVYRVEPIDEGHLGDLSPDSTLDEIRNRWGGGRFKIVAVDEAGQYIASNSRVRIGGDPVFDNEIANRKYTRWLKQSFGKDAPAETTGGAREPDPEDVKEARHARELARIKAENDATLARLRAEIEAKESAEERRRHREREEREATEEKRRAEDRADRERERADRLAEREERALTEERRWKAELEERRADRESKGDPMAQFATMAQVFTALTGAGNNNGPDDPVTALVSRLPEILQETRATGAAMMAASGGGRRPPREPEKRQVRAGQGASVTLEGPIAKKMMGAVERLKKMGKDPEAVLDRMFGQIAGAAPSPGKRLPPKPERKPAPARKAPSGFAARMAAARAAKANGAKAPRTRAPKPAPAAPPSDDGAVS